MIMIMAMKGQDIIESLSHTSKASPVTEVEMHTFMLKDLMENIGLE